jgi:exopolysaccharide biosynthesis polyprenyl glycosylphosphotransferase
MRRILFAVVDALAATAVVALCGGVTAGAVVFAAAAILIDLFERRRAHRLTLSALDDAPVLAIRGVVIAGATTVAGLPVAGQYVPGAGHGAAWLVTAILFAAVATVGRAIGFVGLRRLQRTRKLVSPVLVVGAGSVGRRIGLRLQDHPEYGLVPLGYVDDAAHARGLPPGLLLGDVADLPRLIARHRVRHVIVAFGQMRDTDMVDLLRSCDRLDCEIFVVPRFFELGVGESSAVDHVWGVPLIRLNRAAFRTHTWRAKRILDVLLAALGLVLAGPVMLGIAMLLRREVGPDVLFRQTRVGLDGRPFELLKFRTLHPPRNQEETGFCVQEETGFCVVSADRVGPVGRFLRRSSLDELPQLWNVLRGQMSLVGPRPEQQHFVRRFVRSYPGYAERLRVPAGVTGLAQVHDLRGATPIEDRVCFDNYYIEHWSLWQDIKILTRTVASVVRLRGR